MAKCNTAHVELFRGETYLRIDTPDKEHMVVLLDDRQKLALVKKLLKGIKLPPKGRR
jgi:hypothetical protein